MPSYDLLARRAEQLFDVKGNALCVEQCGFWPAHRLKDITAEKYIGWQTYALEHKSMVLERIALGRESCTTSRARAVVG